MKSNAALTPHNVIPTPHTVIPSEAEGSGLNSKISPLRDATVEMTHENDRLAHAKNYANELNESRLWKIKISYQKRWTSLRRTRKSIEIQLTKPWQHATRPKTAAGKSRSRLNALRTTPEMQAMTRALRVHQRFLTALNLLIRLRKHGHPGANALTAHCTQLGNAATRALVGALLIDGYDFSEFTGKENPA